MTVAADAPVCRTCAVQYPPGPPPDICVICADERQYVPATGQEWTSLRDLADEGHHIDIRGLEPGLHGVGVSPSLGIGQRACLISTPHGNLLWDCVGFIDDEGARAVADLGGIAGIACSHPHFYGAMVEWSHAFDDAPLWLPSADREWVTRSDTTIEWWDDEAEPLPGVHIVQCGGHFDGSAVAVWDHGADGRGAVFVSDTATVVKDRSVSFMRSYPNLMPLPAAVVRHVAERVTMHPFVRIYGGWWDAVIGGGHEVVHRSAARYVRWVESS